MIQNFKNSKSKNGYNKEIAGRYVGTDLPFVYATEKPEPIHYFDQETRKYTDDIVGYRIYVTQHYGDYVQNPIMVRINNPIPEKIQFGQTIKLKGLEACNIRNKDGFSRVYFKANKIEVFNNEKE